MKGTYIALVLSCLSLIQGISINQRPPTISLAQVDQSQQFIGTVLWDIIDLFTFGVFEKKPKNKTNKTEPTPESAPTPQQPQEHYKNNSYQGNDAPHPQQQPQQQQQQQQAPPSQAQPQPQQQPEPAQDDSMAQKIKIEQQTVKAQAQMSGAEGSSTIVQPDPLITYLSLKSEQHQTQLDKDYVQSVFETYSVQGNSLAEQDQKFVTKGNAILAYEEIFNMWKVDLELQQEKTLKDTYFSQAWKKWEKKDENGDPAGNLDLNEAFRFLNDLMTTAKGTPISIVQKKKSPRAMFVQKPKKPIFETSFTSQKTSPYLQALSQQVEVNQESMGIDDNLSSEALQTQMEDAESQAAGTVLGSQAKGLYGDISKFNNQLLKSQMMYQEQNRDLVRAQAQQDLQAQQKVKKEVLAMSSEELKRKLTVQKIIAQAKKQHQ